MIAAENPFRTTRLDALDFRPQDCTWPELMSRLLEQGGRGAFVGPEGHGKTAALDSLARRLEMDGRHVLRLDAVSWREISPSIGSGALRAFGPDAAVLIDSAERLHWPVWLYWRWRLRHAGMLVIATHRDGRLPTLLRCTTSPALFCGLVAELVGSRTAPQRGTLEDFYHSRDGNIRLALLDLYDQWAEGGMPWPTQ